MNQQDHELAGKIVQLLNSGTAGLDRKACERLINARQVALARYKHKPEPVWNLAWAGHAIVRFGEYRVETRHLIAVAILIAGLIGAVYWQNRAPAREIVEIDLGLLTDDLPINAYLDRGFDSWLKRSAR